MKFLKECQTYSQDSSPVAKLMLSMLGAVAEFERSIIRERQAEGIAKAKVLVELVWLSWRHAWRLRLVA
ncbi:hypothetical protein CGUA_01615 [Corynebacterium guangdongense]|uniref:DNA invertase Pin-like site-specific DNA recombinase n=1 Tax=Corynebacterium guangdongense TaxID=1783348 RepID=A0ABU1ZTT9_9CORY|nr:DNA invertase Pin-like site-specific DNA recombinase [Corynebacterium guangdongense]WJZ16923.1 hypothetical protein CGUA_01615 [Corynebacterium guangdongense]